MPPSRAGELVPLDPRYHGRLADLARVAGDLPAAIGHYRRALALYPQDSAARTNLGWLLYRQGELAAAVEHFRTVVDRTPNSAAQFNLGLALLAQGDTDAARTATARALPTGATWQREFVAYCRCINSVQPRGPAGWTLDRETAWVGGEKQPTAAPAVRTKLQAVRLAPVSARQELERLLG